MRETCEPSRSGFRASRGAAVVVVMLFLGLPISGSDLSGQMVRGALLDHGTHRPIARAAVTLHDTAGATVAATVTNAVGRFALATPGPGIYLLKASAIGYERLTIAPFELGEDEDPVVELPLTPSPVPIPGLRVEVERIRTHVFLETQGFHRRQQRGFGRFFTPDEIEAVDPQRWSDLLTRAPGLYFRNDGYIGEALYCDNSQLSLTSRGPETPQVYIDGARVYFPTIGRAAEGPSYVYLDPLLPITQVAAIEVYRGGGTTPVEFSATNNSSCTVLIWTEGG